MDIPPDHQLRQNEMRVKNQVRDLQKPSTAKTNKISISYIDLDNLLIGVLINEHRKRIVGRR